MNNENTNEAQEIPLLCPLVFASDIKPFIDKSNVIHQVYLD